MQAEMTTLLQNTMNGPMRGMMRGGPGGFFFGGLMTAIWAAIIVLLVLWIVRNWPKISAYLRRTAATVQATAPAPSSVQTPLEIVQSRYAKGEISREEYETIRRDLSGAAPAEA